MTWLLWPCLAIWRLFTLVLALTGRTIAVALGLALLIAGAVLTATVIGGFLGIPLMVIGGLLVLRGLF